MLAVRSQGVEQILSMVVNLNQCGRVLDLTNQGQGQVVTMCFQGRLDGSHWEKSDLSQPVQHDIEDTLPLVVNTHLAQENTLMV